jgi:hypothetical protein
MSPPHATLSITIIKRIILIPVSLIVREEYQKPTATQAVSVSSPSLKYAITTRKFLPTHPLCKEPEKVKHTCPKV